MKRAAGNGVGGYRDASNELKRFQNHDETRSNTDYVEIPSNRIGSVIGHRGDTIREISQRTGCKVSIPSNDRNRNIDPSSMVRITITGRDVEEAKQLIRRVVAGRQLLPPFEGIECPAEVNKIYLDVLNFVDSHFFTDLDDWTITPVLERVQQLVQACKSRGITLIVFIDSLRTDEALDKWRDRMTKAVIAGARNVPQNISGIMAELFHKCGVEVRLSTEVNNDDTLASYSKYDHAPLLSGDKDFLRYVNADGTPAGLEIFSSFRVINGKLLIQKRVYMDLEGKRQILETPPGYQRFGVDEDAWVKSLSRNRAFRGGAPSPLVRALQFNPYLRIRPLRVALYKELLKHDSANINQPIREEFPLWDGTKVIFPVEDIDITGPQDENMLGLLRDPYLAFRQFFPRELDKTPPPGISHGDWYRHCHGCRVILIELTCYLPELKSSGMTFLDTLISSDNW